MLRGQTCLPAPSPFPASTGQGGLQCSTSSGSRFGLAPPHYRRRDRKVIIRAQEPRQRLAGVSLLL